VLQVMIYADVGIIMTVEMTEQEEHEIRQYPLRSCKKSTMIFLQEGRILHGDC
jgi:hypothetical protein